MRSGSPRDVDSGELRVPQLSPKRGLGEYREAVSWRRLIPLLLDVKKLRPLTRGGSGSEVYIVKVNGWICCSKVTRFSSSSLPDVIAFEKEIEILKELPSQNKFIVQYLGFQRTEEQLEVFTSLYDGNLLELIEKQAAQKTPFVSREILVIADSVLNALVTLHSRKLIHRDVKSANVFYEVVDGKMTYVLGKTLCFVCPNLIFD